ncbi:EtfB protein [Novimethylophilus kurashikiensis]|uniref:EtfB protein n=1 Tax=Novimethylophilus kurashikiensis TaxID=1825523 RepID=A0A2R5F494_9PROT|nr:EtfB protein [Novimethylophilus kurashikiensis]
MRNRSIEILQFIFIVLYSQSLDLNDGSFSAFGYILRDIANIGASILLTLALLKFPQSGSSYTTLTELRSLPRSTYPTIPGARATMSSTSCGGKDFGGVVRPENISRDQ